MWNELNMNSLVNKMRQAVSDKATRRRKGKEAMLTADSWSWQATVSSLLRILKNVRILGE
jgi:hypothetical protein